MNQKLICPGFIERYPCIGCQPSSDKCSKCKPNIMKIETFDCPECDYQTSNIRIIKNLKHTLHGDSICPKCGVEGVVTVESHPPSSGKGIMRGSDLVIEIRGGCSIDGRTLARKLKNFLKAEDFKKIRVTGLRNDMYGWDGFCCDESVEIIFTDYPIHINR